MGLQVFPLWSSIVRLSSMQLFQMLLGVNEQLRDMIRRSGHDVRIYIPFGRDWYAYSVRRLRENPRLAGYVFKATFRWHNWPKSRLS